MVAFVLVGLAIMAQRASAASEVPAVGERLITIYDNGVEQTVITRATTVKDALAHAGVQLEAADSVEPALDTELVAKNYQLNVYRARPVLIIDGEKRVSVMTAAQSPRQIVSSAGGTLYDEDTAEFSRIDSVTSDGGAGLRLVVDRATVFQFTLYGKTFEARTQAATVGDMLAEKKVLLGSDDGVSVPQSTPLVAGMSVGVWRNGKQTVTVEEAIAKPVEEIKDTEREIGYRAVKTPGTDGKKQVTYEIEMRGGIEVARTAISSVTTLEPVKEVVVVGAKVRGAYTTPSENQIITWNYLIAQGFTREQTAGIMGNLMQEHGFRTDGDGLVQWTGARKTALMSLPDPYNIYTQLDFMMSELNAGYARVQANLRATTSVEQAVVVFQNQYEKCGVCAESNRVQFAYNILATH